MRMGGCKAATLPHSPCTHLRAPPTMEAAARPRPWMAAALGRAAADWGLEGCSTSQGKGRAREGHTGQKRGGEQQNKPTKKKGNGRPSPHKQQSGLMQTPGNACPVPIRAHKDERESATKGGNGEEMPKRPASPAPGCQGEVATRVAHTFGSMQANTQTQPQPHSQPQAPPPTTISCARLNFKCTITLEAC